MIPRAFAYRRPSTLAEAVGLLAEDPQGTKLIAGGHSLLPLMKMRLAAPARLVDIARLAELRGITGSGDVVVIGAATTYREIRGHAVIRQQVPMLAEAVGQIGDLQVRNRGTIGGSLAHADPSADLPAVLLALDAQLEAVGPSGVRTVSIHDFLQGPLMTALAPDEVLTRIRIPVGPASSRSTYLKRPHPASGYAVVGVAAVVQRADDGIVREARIGITGVGVAPFRARTAEALLAGGALSPEQIRRAAEAAAEDGEFLDDALTHADYRRQLCRVYVRRALEKIAE